MIEIQAKPIKKKMILKIKKNQNLIMDMVITKPIL